MDPPPFAGGSKSTGKFPRIQQTAHELIHQGSKWTNPQQKFALVSVVKDILDASVPAEQQLHGSAMAILSAFPDRDAATAERRRIVDEGFTGPLYIVPMGMFGVFPPPDNVPREYHDEQLDRIFRRYRDIRNAATSTLRQRVKDMREREAEELEAAQARETEFRSRVARGEIVDQKEHDEAVALHTQRAAEMRLEADRLQAEQTKPDEPCTDPEYIKSRFSEEMQMGCLKAETGWKSRGLKRAAGSEDAVAIPTCVGRINYIPTRGAVLDEDALAANKKLRELGCPELIKGAVGDTHRERAK
jgi:hypothetical protein